LHPERGHARKRGDVMTFDRADYIACRQIFEGNDLHPGRPGGKQLVLTIVEDQWQHGERPVAGTERPIRSAERREGKEGGSKGRSRWGPNHYKKKKRRGT